MLKTIDNKCPKIYGDQVSIIVSKKGEPIIRALKDNGSYWLLTVLIGLLLIAIGVNLLAVTPVLAQQSYTLEITGDGVASPIAFTLDDLQNMEQSQHIYSTINTWPTKRFYTARGVNLKYLLDLAKISEDARLIRFTSYDGYEVTLTVKELIKDKRYYFPYLADNHPTDGSIPGSSSDAEEVEPILALISAENSTNPHHMNDMNTLLFIYGQRAVTEQTNNLFLKHVDKIEVLTDAPEKWDKPKANIQSEEVATGTQIELNSKGNDIDKVYYTTDGSTPTINSPMFNWSAKRWWSQRPDNLQMVNQPIDINRDTVIKAIVIGPGKEDSEVATFSYKVGLTDSLGQNLPGGPPTSITLDRDIINLQAGGTFELDATIGPDNATDKRVTWSSSDTRIATVDNHGLVTMVGEGTAVITAKTLDGNVEATCIVTSSDNYENENPVADENNQESDKMQENISDTALENDPDYLAPKGEIESEGSSSLDEQKAEMEELPANLVYLVEKETMAPGKSSIVSSSSTIAYAGDLFEVSIDNESFSLPVEQSSLKTFTLPILTILFISGAHRRYLKYSKEVAG